jgi:hypothetical protein
MKCYIVRKQRPRGIREKSVKNLDSMVTSELVEIWIKFHLNPKSVILAFITGSIQVCFQRKTFKIENGRIAVKAMY